MQLHKLTNEEHTLSNACFEMNPDEYYLCCYKTADVLFAACSVSTLKEMKHASALTPRNANEFNAFLP